MSLDALFETSRRAPRLAGRGLVKAYRYTLSPLIGFNCRHLPTCSDYADQAIERYGLWAGGWMTMARLLRCQPLGTSGLDFVADALPNSARWYLPWRYARWRGTNAAKTKPMTDTTSPIRRINPPELGTPPGYSQVVEVRAGRIVFIAGQTALDSDGNLVGKNDFAAQAEQVFQNLRIALQSAGCTASHLVKLTVFLRDMNNLGAYREARNRFFATVTPPAAPAITLIEVSRLYGADFLIEIEAIAAI